MEALAQTSVILSMKSTDGTQAGKGMYLVGAKNFKWKKMVRPGDTLYLEVTFIKRKKSLWIIDGIARVNSEIVCSGSLSAIEAD